MAEKKTNILWVYNILKKYTDSDHVLTREQIFELLKKEKPDIQMDRRTFYGCIHTLQEYGIDVADYSQNKEGYQLLDRTFEESEAILLCNAVHASNFIPRNYSEELIDKILKTQSVYISQEYKNTVFVENLRKKENPDFFLNLDTLLEAIRTHRKISFQYMRYDLNKQMVPRREELYTVSPYYLVYAQEKTYLIAKTVHHETGFTHYRIDRIQNIQILKEPTVKLLKEEDPYVYAANKLYMYGGKEVTVTLSCSNTILDDMIDLYGTSIPIRKTDAEHFETEVHSTRQGIIYLAQQYLNYMTVLDPEEIRKEIAKILKQKIKEYGK